MAKPSPAAKPAAPAPKSQPSGRPTAEQLADQLDSAEDIALARKAADIAEARGVDPEEPVSLVRVYNRGEGSFIHGPYVCSPKGFCDVPQDVADIWASHSYNGKPAVVLASTMQAPVAAPNAAEVARKDKLIAEQEEALKNLGGLLEQLRAAAPGASDQDLISRLKAGAPPAQ